MDEHHPHLPDVLFDPDDVFAVWPKPDKDDGEQGDNGYPEAIGFKTTSKRAIGAFERNGFTLELCADVYGFFDRELQRTYEASVTQRLTDTGVSEEELEGRIERHLATFPKLSKREEVAEFVAFLKVWLSSDFNSAPFDKPVVLTFDGGREYKIPPSEYMLARRARGIKVNLYGRVFNPLSESEERLRTRVVQAECRELLRQCGQAKTAAAKGRALEALIEVLFTANHAFDIVGKRVTTGDEEIDIIVKNN